MWSHRDVLRIKRARQKSLLCEHLKTARTEARLTQVQVAKLLNFDKCHPLISRFDPSHERLMPFYLQSLLSFFCVSVPHF